MMTTTTKKNVLTINCFVSKKIVEDVVKVKVGPVLVGILVLLDIVFFKKIFKFENKWGRTPNRKS